MMLLLPSCPICSSTLGAFLLLAALASSLLHCCCQGRRIKSKRGKQVVTRAHDTHFAKASKPRMRMPSDQDKSIPKENKKQGGGKNEFGMQSNAEAKPIDSLTCGVHMRRARKLDEGGKSNATGAKKTDDIYWSEEPCLPKTFTLGTKERNIKEHNLKKDVAAVDPYPTISLMFSSGSQKSQSKSK